jgi:hypothetical protein
MSALTMPAASVRRDGEAAPEGAATSHRVAVPWLSVLPLAALLAYADGFWMTSLRGATGAIERTQAPLVSWVKESTLVLPLFVVAVLAAFTLAMRWFGPRVSTPRRVLATALLVVAAASLASTAWLVASAAYDYHLQFRQVAMMGSMGTVCVGHCLTLQEHSTLTLQLRAVAYGTGILVASNLVVVTWLVALRGGRLTLGATQAPDTGIPTATEATGRDERAADGRRQDLQLLLTAALLAAGVLHAAVVPAQLHGSTTAGAFFVLLTALELGMAVQVMGRPRGSVLVGAAVISVAPLVVWLYSSLFGLPFLPKPGVAEPVGLADSAATLLEIVALLAVWMLARDGRGSARPRASAHVRGIALVAMLAVAAVGLGGTGLALFNALGDTSHHSRVHQLVPPTRPVSVPAGSSAGTGA